MKDTTAKQPSKELLALGYTNNDGKVNNGVSNDDVFALRRDYLIENLFVSEFIRESFCDDEEYKIVVATGLGFTLIYLDFRSSDKPNRMAVDLDGEVFVSRGNDEPFFSPSLILPDSCWEHHDDEFKLAGLIPIDSDGCHVINGSHNPWTSCLCIPLVTTYNPGPETMMITQEKFNL